MGFLEQQPWAERPPLWVSVEPVASTEGQPLEVRKAEAWSAQQLWTEQEWWEPLLALELTEESVRALVPEPGSRPLAEVQAERMLEQEMVCW